MKSTTEIWMRIESVGKPQDSVTLSGPMMEVAKRFVGWMFSHSMANYIKVTVARSENELERLLKSGVRGNANQEIEDMFSNLFAGLDDAVSPVVTGD